MSQQLKRGFQGYNGYIQPGGLVDIDWSEYLDTKVM
jgi:hypothetical protein